VITGHSILALLGIRVLPVGLVALLVPVDLADLLVPVDLADLQDPEDPAVVRHPLKIAGFFF